MIDSSAFTESRFRKMILRNKSFCFVAEADGLVVGNIFSMNDGAFIGYIGKICVDKDYRRHKIASELVKKVIEKFKKLGITLIFGHVVKENLPSMNMLKSLGFEIRDSHYLMDVGFKKK